MPRTARAIVGGMIYHVLNRGNNRARVFHSAADYARFVTLMSDAQSRVKLDVLGVCLMPNHFHLMLRPKGDDDLSQWMQWLLTTHVRRYHLQHRSSGRVWQGRFKAFPIQDDTHLFTVLRYVERNALSANLVDRAEVWPWGSLRWRMAGDSSLKLTALPLRLPANWVDLVNTPLAQSELERVRICVQRQRPFGDAGWVEVTARKLGLSGSLSKGGRPVRW
jgi:putative transposase